MANSAFCRRHREPDATLAARIADDLHALPGLRRQHVGERRLLVGARGDDRRRHRPPDVVLREKCGHDVIDRAGVGMPGKVAAVADMPAAADHHDVDGNLTLGRGRRDDVDVPGRRAFDELPRLQPHEPRDLVADPRGALEFQCRTRLVHLRLELRQHLGRLSLQEQHRALHVVRVVGRGDEADAGRAATRDLVQHARARAVGEHRVLAGAQLEHLLQQRHSLAHRARARERAEVPVLAIELAAMEGELRKRFAGQADVRVALVVAEQDVVARLVRLDQVVLEQQRLAFGARDRRLDPRDLREHQRDPRLVRALLEIARHALLQVARLADVERRAGRVEHPVDARAVRQRGDELARVERRRTTTWSLGGRRHVSECGRESVVCPRVPGAWRWRRRPRGTSSRSAARVFVL